MPNSDNMTTSPSSKYEYPWHQSTWERFIRAREINQLPHAILLSGEEGIAKLALAVRMAKSLICKNTQISPADACQQCQSCKTYESGANPDFIQVQLLEDKQQIGVDQIRELSEFLHYSRSYNTYRVVILHPVERMNLNAANSLLKSLEEPSANTVIILVTAKLSQLLPTIRSRCQQFNVTTPSKDESTHYLQQYQTLQDQDKLIDIETLLEIAGNKPLKAININPEDIDDRNKYFQDLSAVIHHQIPITEMAKKWEKYDFERLLNWQIVLLQKTIKLSLATARNELNTGNASHALTQHLSNEEHWRLYQNLIKQKTYIHTSVNTLMFAENMITFWLKGV